jgi:predicted nuclease of predicted toxin-antitoxin system
MLAGRKSRQPSVIQIRTQMFSRRRIGPIVLRALNASRLQLEEGALVAVDPTRNRIRLLPI